MQSFMNDLQTDTSLSVRDDSSTKAHKTKPLPGTHIPSPALIGFIGSKGSGKTTLISRLLNKFSQKKIFDHYIVCYQGSLDETFTSNMRKFSGKNMVLVEGASALSLFMEYARVKMDFLNVIRYIDHPDTAVANTTVQKFRDSAEKAARANRQAASSRRYSGSGPDVETMFTQMLEDTIDTYSSDFILTVDGQDYEFSGMTRKTKCLVVFDDMGKFADMVNSGSSFAKTFIGLLNDVRHYLVDVWFGGQNLIMLAKGIRRGVDGWFLGYGIPYDDAQKYVPTLGGFPHDVPVKTVTEDLMSLNKYEWVFISPDHYEVIRNESGKTSQKTSPSDKKEAKERVSMSMKAIREKISVMKGSDDDDGSSVDSDTMIPVRKKNVAASSSSRQKIRPRDVITPKGSERRSLNDVVIVVRRGPRDDSQKKK